MSAELGEKEEGAMATAAAATATTTTATAAVAPANEGSGGGGSGSNGNGNGMEVSRELQSSNNNSNSNNNSSSNNNSNSNSNRGNKSGGGKNGNGIDTTYTKIFVGGLAWETNRDALKAHFEQFGDILEAVIISDKNTGRSKGYGFVTYRDPEGARRACLDPSPVIDGRRANCNLASLGLANRGRSSSLQQGYNNSNNNNNNNNNSSSNHFQQGSPFNQYLSIATPPHHQRPAYAGGFKFPAFHYPPFEQGFPHPPPSLSPYGYSSYQSDQNFLGCYYNPYYLMQPQFSQVYNAGQSLGIANTLNFPSPTVSSVDQKNQAVLQYTHPPSANLTNAHQYYMLPTPLPTLPPSSPGVPLPFYSAANTVSDHVPVASPQQYTATSPPMQQFAHLPSQQMTV